MKYATIAQAEQIIRLIKEGKLIEARNCLNEIIAD